MRSMILSLLAVILFASIGEAQSPTPLVVRAMTPAVTANPSATPDPAAPIQAALKALQTMKAANEEILKQQAATLQKLDEMEKVANEIKIYTKRS
jgi:hypothetical protein